MSTTTDSKKYMHYRIVENGKLLSLKGDHQEALRHYKEGIRMCAQEKAPEIFFQHYSQCVMESLELSGAHDEVIAFCDRTIALLIDKVDQSDFIKKNYAVTLERKAIQFLLKEEKEEAVDAFKKVQTTIGRGNQPLTDELLNWAQRGYTISTQQIKAVQKKHKYFAVTKENVNAKIAMELPKSVMPL